jgi:hypothetical protein
VTCHLVRRQFQNGKGPPKVGMSPFEMDGSSSRLGRIQAELENIKKELDDIAIKLMSDTLTEAMNVALLNLQAPPGSAR